LRRVLEPPIIPADVLETTIAFEGDRHVVLKVLGAPLEATGPSKPFDILTV